MMKIISSITIVIAVITANAHACEYDYGCDCTPIVCDITQDAKEMIHYFVDQSISDVGNAPNKLCKIAEKIRDFLEMYYENKGWVVFVGDNAIFQDSFSYASVAVSEPGTHLRYLHKRVLSVEVFRAYQGKPVVDRDEPLPSRNKLSNILGRNLKNIGNGMTRAIGEILAKDPNMPPKREINLKKAIDKGFQNVSVNFKNTAFEIYNSIQNDACKEGWYAVLVGRYGVLSNSEQSCGVYNHYSGTKLMVRFKQTNGVESHEALVFAPKDEPDENNDDSSPKPGH